MTMKKIQTEMGGVMGLIAKRWPHVKGMKIVDDGTKYGSSNPKDLVRNEILGVVPAGDVMMLHKLGGLVYKNGGWYVGRDLVPTITNAKPHYPVNKHFLEYRRKGRMTADQRVNDEARRASIDDPITQMSGTE